MAAVVFSPASPYRLTQQTSWYTGRYVSIAVPPDSSDVEITLSAKYQYRPDTLSQDLYGTWEFWWVFMIRNPSEITHPILSMQAGLTIMVPAAGRLAALRGMG